MSFTPENSGFNGLSRERSRTVIEAWSQRTAAMSALTCIKQVFPFENRGADIGVTLHHPHGQIYAVTSSPAFFANADNIGSVGMERGRQRGALFGTSAGPLVQSPCRRMVSGVPAATFIPMAVPAS